MGSDDNKKVFTSAIYRLCRPLVRILIRNGIPFAGFADIAKRAYVDVAMNDFSVPGRRKVSDSRISTITGLTRKEVRRVKNLEIHAGAAKAAEHYNRAARVIFGWIHDPKYMDDKGLPLVLPFDGDSPSFSELVRHYSGDVPPRAVLDELEQVGVVVVLANNAIKIMKRGYIPSASETEKLKLFGRDTAGLITTIDRNIYGKDAQPFFQRKVCYDALSDEARKEIRELLEQKGQELLVHFDSIMAKHDMDINPDIKGKGRKAAGIGVYYFEDNSDEEIE